MQDLHWSRTLHLLVAALICSKGYSKGSTPEEASRQALWGHDKAYGQGIIKAAQPQGQATIQGTP